MANLGNAATGNVEPFAAARRALEAGGGQALSGFLRPQAYLLVVIVAGQDDAGSSPVADTVMFLKSLKEDPSKVMVSAVAPPTACADGGAAMAAPRLLELVQAFGFNGVYSPLCQDNALRLAFQRALDFGNIDVSPPCVRVRDTDLATPGVQAECAVEDRNGGVSTVLPACDHAAPPCWRLTGESFCRSGEVMIDIDHGPDWCLQDGLFVVVTCLTCLHANDPACNGR
jgi:hypothetical protein